MISRIRFEDVENWVIQYGPKATFFRIIMGKIKGEHVSRHTMSEKDVKAVELRKNNKISVLKRYEQKWPFYTKRFKNQIREYLALYPKAVAGMDKKELMTDIIFCHYAYGFLQDEYFAYQLKNKHSLERRSYISDRDRLKFIYKVNDIVDMDIVRNKNLTYKKFQKYYHRDAINIEKDGDFQKFCSFVKKHPIFVQKNVRKNCGQGVKLINFKETNETYETYFRKLRLKDDYLLEACIPQSTVMSSLHPSSVNTIRFVTLVTDKGILVDHCFLKVGRNNAFLDNGAAGGLLVGINQSNGMLCTNGYSEFLEVYEKHPNSDVIFKGFQLPQWNEALLLAEKLASKYPSIRFVGWDLAHTEQGWVLVEGNGRSQVIGPQIIYGKGLKQHFEELMKVDFD